VKKIWISLVFPVMVFGGEVTTSNLLPQTFTSGNGYSGDIDHNHGTGTLATQHNDVVTHSGISLSNDANMSTLQIQDGFSVEHKSNIWFWNNRDQSATMSMVITDSSGGVHTSSRTIDSDGCGYTNCGAWQNYIDTFVGTANTHTDYNIVTSYSVSVPGTSGHYGADIRQPSLKVTYQEVPITVLTATEIGVTVKELDQIIEIFKNIIPETFTEIFIDDFIEVKIDEPMDLITIEEQFIEDDLILAVIETEPEILETIETVEIKEEQPIEIIETVETAQVIEEENIEIVEEEIYAELTEESLPEEAEETTSSGSEPEPELSGTESGTVGDGDEVATQATPTETNTVSGIDDIAAKVAARIQDLDKRLEVTQLIVAKVIMGKNNNVINAYSKFGNEIFSNQLEVTEISLTTAYLKELEQDNRILASPVFTKYQNKLDKANDDVIRAEENLRRIKIGH